MKKIFIRFFVIVFATLLTMGFCEIAVRIFWDKLTGQTVIPLSLKTHRISKNKRMGYELIPDSRSFEDGALYQINRDGLRDVNYSLQKPAQAFRIAAVGDSCTFGMAVTLADTWPKQLEKTLRSSHPGIEVINFGVMGYDTTQEAERIRGKVLSYSPDLIIIGYSLNDIGILSRERTMLGTYKGYDTYLKTGVGILDRVLAHSKLFLLIKNRLFLKKIQAESRQPKFSKDGRKKIKLGYNGFLLDAYTEPKNSNRLKTAFRKINRLTYPKIPVLIAIYPELRDFDRYPFAELHEIVKKLAAENNFSILDPLPEFIKQDPQKVRISNANTHPNPLGNQIYARAIARYLVENSLIK